MDFLLSLFMLLSLYNDFCDGHEKMKTLLLQYFQNKGNCLEQYYTLIVVIFIYFRYRYVSSAILAAPSCVIITQGQSIPICCP